MYAFELSPFTVFFTLEIKLGRPLIQRSRLRQQPVYSYFNFDIFTIILRKLVSYSLFSKTSSKTRTIQRGYNIDRYICSVIFIIHVKNSISTICLTKTAISSFLGVIAHSNGFGCLIINGINLSNTTREAQK